jgi:hypothetical protein
VDRRFVAQLHAHPEPELTAVREQLLRPTIVLTVVAWMLSVVLRATPAAGVLLGFAIALTVVTGMIALFPERRRRAGPRPALDQRELGLLRQAIQEKRDVSFTYQSRDGSATTRRVTPVELFEVGDALCLGAFCHLRNGDRTFVLERVGPIELEGPSQPRDSEIQQKF